VGLEGKDGPMPTGGERINLEQALQLWESGDPTWLDSSCASFLAELAMEVLIHAQQIFREVEQELACIEQNLTVTDARVLAHLGFVGSDTLAAMSQRLSIPRTTMHYALRKMERRGWLERREGEQRADQPVFSLTSRGKKQMAAVLKAFFHPVKGSITYDYIALANEPLVAVAMALRAMTRLRSGGEDAERIAGEAERIVALVRQVQDEGLRR